MTTRIGLISDVHSSPDLLAEALRIFADRRVDDIICAGDIAGYYDRLLPTVRLLRQSNCKAIIGNHDQKWLQKNPGPEDAEIRDYLQRLPQTLQLVVEGKRLFVVHANPPSEQHGGIKLRNQTSAPDPATGTHLFWRNKSAELDIPQAIFATLFRRKTRL